MKRQSIVTNFAPLGTMLSETLCNYSQVILTEEMQDANNFLC